MNVLKVECVGTFPGGTYDKVDVDGVATINGDLNAEIIDIDGVFTLSGSVECRSFSCDGTGTIRGNVHAEEMDIDGVVTVEGMVQANKFDCDGTAKVRGDMRCNIFEVDGVMTVTGTKLESGSIAVDGALSAKNAQISADKIVVDGRIQADEIVGESVHIDSAGLLTKIFQAFSSRNSSANLIEATTVELENVCAGTVSGRDIRLKGGCNIARVDCCGTLFIESSCQVREITGEYSMV